MELTDKQRKVYHGLECPYCGIPSVLASSVEVYGKDYGYIRLCRQCGAYVGCHKGTQVAKGRLANLQLRLLKIKAHNTFDQLWKQNYMTRTEAYQWLSNHLGLDLDFTHIGWFNEDTCNRVISGSEEQLRLLQEVDMISEPEPETTIRFAQKPTKKKRLWAK